MNDLIIDLLPLRKAFRARVRRRTTPATVWWLELALPFAQRLAAHLGMDFELLGPRTGVADVIHLCLHAVNAAPTETTVLTFDLTLTDAAQAIMAVRHDEQTVPLPDQVHWSWLSQMASYGEVLYDGDGAGRISPTP